SGPGVVVVRRVHTRTVAWTSMDTVRRPTRKIAIAAVVLAVAAGLTGCTNAVAMSPAPSANAAACADVQVRLPAAVDTKFDLRNTNAQSTAAWGDPEVAI